MPRSAGAAALRRERLHEAFLSRGPGAGAGTRLRPGLWTRRSHETKQADIKKLLGITGASNTGLRVFSQVIGMFQRAHSDVPEAVWIEMVSGAEAKVDAFVMEMLVPIYDKHLTHADIKDLIAFYETPVGRKLLAVMPQMHHESRTAGEIWGREFARTVQEKLAEKGFE